MLTLLDWIMSILPLVPPLLTGGLALAILKPVIERLLNRDERSVATQEAKLLEATRLNDRTVSNLQDILEIRTERWKSRLLRHGLRGAMISAALLAVVGVGYLFMVDREVSILGTVDRWALAFASGEGISWNKFDSKVAAGLFLIVIAGILFIVKSFWVLLQYAIYAVDRQPKDPVIVVDLSTTRKNAATQDHAHLAAGGNTLSKMSTLGADPAPHWRAG